jgi:VanZ family protein
MERILRERMGPDYAKDEAMIVAERLLLLVMFLLVVVYTLAPFELSAEVPGLLERGTVALDWTSTGGLLNLPAHFGTFLALGTLFSVVHGEWVQRHGIARFTIAVVGLCTLLELAQLFQDTRHARISDWLANIAGLWMGVQVIPRWRRGDALVRRAKAWRPQIQPCLHLAVLLIAVLVWFMVGLAAARGGLLMGWQEDYRLLLGNEEDASRPWLGKIAYVGIYGRALEPAEVANLHRLATSNGEVDRLSFGLLVGYDFRADVPHSLVPQGALSSRDNLILRGFEGISTSREAGLFLSEPSLLASKGAANELVETIRGSKSFSVEAWVEPASKNQGGPARIVTMSNGIAERNFTLGQEASGFVFRLRNAMTGVNGVRHELRVRGATETNLQHLVASYGGGVSLLYKDGRPSPYVVDLREPTLPLQLGPSRWGKIAGGMLLAVAVALPTFALLRRRWSAVKAHSLALLVAIVVGCAPYIVNALLVGGPWLAAYPAWLTGGIMFTYPLALLYTRGRASTLRSLDRAPA